MRWIRHDKVAAAEAEIGNTYGYIHVVGVSEKRSKQRRILHEVTCTRCNDGFVYLINLSMAKCGGTKSCGCLRSDLGLEKTRRINEARVTNNETTT